MENNCAKCFYCKCTGDIVSPGGRLVIWKYQCTNPDSENYETQMNVVEDSMEMQRIDSRTNNTCDKFKANSQYANNKTA